MTANLAAAAAAFHPAAYRIFAEADPHHQWTQLVDSSYETIDLIHSTRNFGGTTGFIPTYVKLDPIGGQPRLVGEALPGADAFSPDASHLLWRLALDYVWFGDERAKKEIGDLHYPKERLLLERTGGELGTVSAEYGMDGSILTPNESLTMYAALVPSLLVTDDANLDLANRAFAEGASAI